MFFVRQSKSLRNAKRLLLPSVYIAAKHDQLPLKDENWAERWCLLTKDFEEVFEQTFNFAVRDDDVFLVTFIKCGTTWMQETAWLLMNQLNFQRAKEEGVLQRSTFLDFSGLFNNMPENSIEMCNRQKSPRLIKTHLPANLLPKQFWQKKPKTIYVARNARDVVVSSYHFVKGLSLWDGNINEFVQDFMNDEIYYTPFWAHIVDFWKLRDEPNIFFVTYEEMKRDLAGVITRLCAFLERPQLTNAEMEQLLEHLSFEKMRENKRTNLTYVLKDTMPTHVADSFQFMRRGIVGCYKDELSEENQLLLAKWSREFLAKHGIKESDIFGDF